MPRPAEPSRAAVEALLDCRNRGDLLRGLGALAAAVLGSEVEVWTRPEGGRWRRRGVPLVVPDRPTDRLVAAALGPDRSELPCGWTLLRGRRVGLLAYGWGLEARSESVEAVLLLVDALLPALDAAPALEAELDALPAIDPSRPAARGRRTALDLLRPDCPPPPELAGRLAALPLPPTEAGLARLLGRFRLETPEWGPARLVLASTGPEERGLDPEALQALETLEPDLTLEQMGPEGPILRLGARSGPGRS